MQDPLIIANDEKTTELEIFLSKAYEYLKAYKGIHADDTHKQLRKRYKRLARHTYDLHHTLNEDNQPAISTMDPELFTTEDIKAMYVYLRQRGLSPSGIDHEISALSMLCRYHLNDAVTVFKIRYPTVSKKTRHDVISLYSRQQYVKVLECAYSAIANEPRYTKRWYYRIRAYALVSFSLYGGLRCDELRFVKFKNLDVNNGTILLEDVKGSGTYGSRRIAPLRPECLPVIREFLKAREWYGVDSEYLFVNGDNKILCNSSPLRITGVWIDRDVGFHITFQDCRRAYAQYALDDGATNDYMQVALGHASPETTFGFYAKLRQNKAVDSILKIFRSNPIGG